MRATCSIAISIWTQSQGHDQGLLFKDQDKDKDFSSKDKDKDKDCIVKDKDQDKDCILVLKDKDKHHWWSHTQTCMNALLTRRN